MINGGDIADLAIMQAMNTSRQYMLKCHKFANEDLIKHAMEIEAASNLFCDKASRDAYIRELTYITTRTIAPEIATNISPFTPEMWAKAQQEYRKLCDEKKIPVIKPNTTDNICGYEEAIIENFVLNGYSYQDIVTIEQGEVFIDCGAYIGDTAIWAYQHNAAKVYSFEPCQDNWSTLQSNLADNNLPTKFYPYAVGNENKKLMFRKLPYSSYSARIINEQHIENFKQNNPNSTITEVDCIRLDDWFNQNSVIPTFIKMDIEGAEVDALHGCAETIKKYKPKLAICLYHKPEHMWEIPLLVHSLVPEYKFYCHKSYYYCEFVMFAKA